MFEEFLISYQYDFIYGLLLILFFGTKCIYNIILHFMFFAF
jgi:hypothetical protein